MKANEFIKQFNSVKLLTGNNVITIDIISQFVDNLNLDSDEDYEIIRGYLKGLYNAID